MSLLDRDVRDVWSAVTASADDCLRRMAAEEIKPRHVEEVSMAVLSILLFLFVCATVSPSVSSAQSSQPVVRTAAAVVLADSAGVSSVSSASSLSSSGLTQTQIDAILTLLRSFNANDSTISQVQAALTGSSTATSGAQWCHTFGANLRIGDSGSDVIALQEALQKSGFSVGNDASGTFGEGTASAVSGFQEQYQQDVLAPYNLQHGTGFVGQTTRAKLDSLYGCGIVPTPTPVPPVNPPQPPVTTPPTSPSPLTVGPNDQVVTFTKSFMNVGTGTMTLTIAADNRFSVSLNGTVVDTNNSETNFYSTQTIDLTSFMQPGDNTLAITVDNMVNPETTGTNWEHNPAGLVYRVTQNGETLAVSNGTGQDSVSSTIVIPQDKLLSVWTSIPGAAWIWDSSYYTAAQTAVAPCPTGDCSTTSQVSLQVLSPSGGETYVSGQGEIDIQYSSSGITGQQLTANLYSPTLGNVRSVIGTASSNGTIVMPLAKGGADPAGQYMVNLCALNVDSPTTPGKPLCVNSNGYFTLTNPQPTATITSGTQTSSSNPTITGTASGTPQVGVVLSSAAGDKVYGSGLVPVTDGAWSVTVSPALSAGPYTVTVYDANNNVLTTGSLTVALQTSSSSPLTVGPNDQVVTFTKSFMNVGTGTMTLTIAADNRFSVSLNGTVVDTNNSETNFYSTQTIDLTSFMQPGDNTLAITVDNMVNPETTGTNWEHNPAGLVYRVTQNGETLAVSNGTGQDSVSSTIVIPQDKLLSVWTSIPGAAWIWDSSYYTAAQTAVAPCPTGDCSTTSPTSTTGF